MQSAEHRFFALAVGVATAIGLGWLLGGAFVYLFGNEAALQVIKTVTIAAIVFAVWKIVLDHAASISRFVRAGDVGNCRRAFVELVIAMVGLGVAAGTTTEVEETAPPGLVAMSFIQPLEALVDRIVLPVFSGNLEEGKTLECNNPALQRLAQVDRAALPLIQEVACGLRSCSSGPAVVVDVQGFASSQHFDFEANARCKNSREMNLVLAEMRRENVIRLLDQDLSDVENCKRRGARLPARIEIEPTRDGPRWRDPEAMQNARGWLDMGDNGSGTADRGREIFTRRVDIVVRNKGICATGAEARLAAASER
jgi:hypothetical protein